MKRNYGIATVLAIVAALVFTLMPGCGGGGGGGGTSAVHAPTGSATFSFVMPGGSSARAAGRDGAKIPDNTYMLSIMAFNDDMADPIEEYVSGAPGETVTVTMADIPVGETFFMINAYDSANQIIAAAFEIVTIYEGELSTVYAELGIVTDGAVTLPQAFTLEAGETLNVKNISEVTSVPMSIPGTTCPTGLNMGLNGQLSCTFSTPGTYSLTSGGTTLATITVTAATDSSFVTANASADKGYGDPPLTVQFAGRGVCAACSGTYTYAWDFDDGATSASQNPSHQFSGVGDYVVTLTVTDSNGNTAQDRVNVHVAELPPPLVVSVSPATGSNDVDTTITITGDDFQSGAAVFIGGTQATNVTVVSNTSITATVPAGITANVYDITVENPDGQTGTLSAAFTVTGTSAGTFNAQDYFGLGSGDSWSYISDDVNVSSSVSSGEVIVQENMGTETVNGVSCIKFGENSTDYTCLTSDNTNGVVMYKMVKTETQNGVSVVSTELLDPPVTIVNGTFGLGDSLPLSSTVTITENGVTTTKTFTGTVNVVAVENVVTPAGVFNDCVKIVMVRNNSDGTTETETMWFAMGVGMVKDITVGCSDCGADGYAMILSAASVAGNSWPTALPSGTMDGQYWLADLGSAVNLSSAWSGYYSLTISGSVGSMTGVEGDFTTGNTSVSYAPGTMTLLSNGTFTASAMTTAMGAVSSSGGVGVIIDMGTTETGLKILARKGTSYTSSMIEGDYYAVTYTVGANGEVSTEFSDVAVSAGTVTSTGYMTSSNGAVMQTTGNTENYTFDTTNGTFIITGDAGQYMGMVGENGDILLYVSIGAGDRELTYMVKKGSGIVANTVAGAHLMGELYTENGALASDFTFMDMTADGNIYMVTRENDGTWDIETDTYTVDTYGRLYPGGDPDIFIGVNREQNRAVLSEQSASFIGAGMLVRGQ